MVQNLGNPLGYIGGDGHRPIPTVSQPQRTSHRPQASKPTGLDWNKLRAVPDPGVSTVTALPTTRACKECRAATDLDDLADGFCPPCLDAATARFAPTGTAPHDRRTPVPAEITEPTREVVAVATSKPAYVDDIVAVMVATDGHPDPTVRAARKVVANALVTLHKTLAGVFPQTSAAAESPTAAVGSTNGHRSYKRLSPVEVEQVCSRYQAGESTTQLGRAFGVSAKTISNRLHAAGIPVRPKTGA